MISLSDVVQSETVYKSDFFRNLLLYTQGEQPIVSIIGTKTSQDLENFLMEREEYYRKPGFYNIIPDDEISIFLDNIRKSKLHKSFSTGDTLAYEWSKTFANLDESLSNGSSAITVKNLFVSNRNYFLSSRFDNFIRIPEKLEGFPFVWDSINYLNLIDEDFSQESIVNIKKYLAAKWINCYLENFLAYIPNALLYRPDVSFGLDRSINLKFIINFLKNFQILDLILSLSLEELIEFKAGNSLLLKQLIGLSYNHLLLIDNMNNVLKHIKKIKCEKHIKNLRKLERILNIIYSKKRRVR